MRHTKNKQIIWDAIRAVHAEMLSSIPHHQTEKVAWPVFSITDLEERIFNDKKVRLNGKVFRRYLKGLTAAKYLERVVDGALIQGRWRLIRDEGKTAPYVNERGEVIAYGNVHKQLWQTMRIMKRFDARELRISSTTEECPIGPQVAQQYTSWLVKAGVLVKVGKRRHGQHQTLQLVPSKNTGPRPPMIEKLVRVLDGNTGDVLYEDGGADE